MWAMARLTSIFAVPLLAAPLVVEAQPAKVPVIGTLDYGASDAARLTWWKALREALQELGYEVGQSIAFEALWAEGRVDRLPGLAAELVRRQVAVIVTGGGKAARAAKQATATIPIVMASGADPVQLGLVVSLARPGGNVTGVTSLSSERISKRALKYHLPTAVGGRVLQILDVAQRLPGRLPPECGKPAGIGGGRLHEWVFELAGGGALLGYAPQVRQALKGV